MGNARPKVIVVMPAYNAAETVEKTFRDIPAGTVDEVILNDDNSRDNTVEVARKLGITVLHHDENKGYGANQKSLYDAALEKVRILLSWYTRITNMTRASFLLLWGSCQPESVM